jgi:hypothetical protein
MNFCESCPGCSTLCTVKHGVLPIARARASTLRTYSSALCSSKQEHKTYQIVRLACLSPQQLNRGIMVGMRALIKLAILALFYLVQASSHACMAPQQALYASRTASTGKIEIIELPTTHTLQASSALFSDSSAAHIHTTCKHTALCICSRLTQAALKLLATLLRCIHRL